MNEKIIEKLSAYLDGQVSQEQKAEIEKLINEDSQVRQEYEEMKLFSTAISASRPVDVVAPDGFRTEIMNKLRTQLPNDGNQGGTSGGSGSIINSKWLGYLAAGSVLIGLTSWFVYQDNKNQQKINAAEQVMDQIVEVKNNMKIEMPEYKGKSESDSSLEQVAPSDIQGIEKDTSALGLKNNSELLQGQIYSRGQGRINYGNELEMSFQGNEKYTNVESVDFKKSESYLDLESKNNWTRRNIKSTLRTKKLTNKISAEKCMALAEKYNLNPGLIISLVELNPDKDTAEQVEKIRQILNSSRQLTEEKRLDKIIMQLDGAVSWKKTIQNNLLP